MVRCVGTGSGEVWCVGRKKKGDRDIRGVKYSCILFGRFFSSFEAQRLPIVLEGDDFVVYLSSWWVCIY